MKFLATMYIDGIAFGVDGDADSVEHAESICDEHGWQYDGELIEVFEYDADHPIPSFEVH